MIADGTCAVFVLRGGAAQALKRAYMSVLMWYSAEANVEVSVVAVMPVGTGYMEVKCEAYGKISSTAANCVVLDTEKRKKKTASNC